MNYIVELNYPFDYNVESALFCNGVNVISGEIGALTIEISTDLEEVELLRRCNVDIKRVINKD